MEETRRNVWVGIFVLCGLSALAALVVLFGRGPTALMSGGTYRLHILFDQVSDVRPGNLVITKGIKIGSVTDVRLVNPRQFDAGVDVTIAVENQYAIPEGSLAQTTEAMLGQGRPPIEIIPGPPSAPALAAEASIRGNVRKAIDSLFPPGVVNSLESAVRQIGQAAEDLSPVLREFEQIIQARTPEAVDRGEVQGNIATAAARLDSALKHFNDVLGDPNVKSQVRDIVANAHVMSEQGKQLISDLDQATNDARGMIARTDQAVTNLEQRVGEISRTTMEGLDKASRFMDHLNALGEQIRRGEGNLGLLFMDSKLYESMTITAERLAHAVEEFRALIAEWREGKVRIAL
jgi:ABC-type transporter Mla subunit MlaD